MAPKKNYRAWHKIAVGFVSTGDRKVDEECLREIFYEFGHIADVVVRDYQMQPNMHFPSSQYSTEVTAYAFLYFTDADAAIRAVTAINNSDYNIAYGSQHRSYQNPSFHSEAATLPPLSQYRWIQFHLLDPDDPRLRDESGPSTSKDRTTPILFHPSTYYQSGLQRSIQATAPMYHQQQASAQQQQQYRRRMESSYIDTTTPSNRYSPHDRAYPSYSSQPLMPPPVTDPYHASAYAYPPTTQMQSYPQHLHTQQQLPVRPQPPPSRRVDPYYNIPDPSAQHHLQSSAMYAGEGYGYDVASDRHIARVSVGYDTNPSAEASLSSFPRRPHEWKVDESDDPLSVFTFNAEKWNMSSATAMSSMSHPPLGSAEYPSTHLSPSESSQNTLSFATDAWFEAMAQDTQTKQQGLMSSSASSRDSSRLFDMMMSSKSSSTSTMVAFPSSTTGEIVSASPVVQEGVSSNVDFDLQGLISTHVNDEIDDDENDTKHDVAAGMHEAESNNNAKNVWTSHSAVAIPSTLEEGSDDDNDDEKTVVLTQAYAMPSSSSAKKAKTSFEPNQNKSLAENCTSPMTNDLGICATGTKDV